MAVDGTTTDEPTPDVAVDDFPLRYARTQRFTRGRPRSFTVSPDGERVWFLASDAGDDGVHHLFLHTTSDGTTRRVVDASATEGGEHLTDAERARRERLREGGAGLVAYATDGSAHRVVVVLGGRVTVVDGDGGRLEVEVGDAGPDGQSMFDPRLSPDGRRLAGVVGRTVHLADLPPDLPPDLSPDLPPDPSPSPSPDRSDDSARDVVRTRPLVGPEPEDPAQDAVSWGLAEFVAAEEFDRQRGFWFAPDGRSMLVARVDEADVAVAHIADPVHPRRPPRPHRYPFAGTTNATVDLHLLDLDGDGAITADRVVAPPDDLDAEYLVDVRWDDGHDALVTWQDRAQVRMVTTRLAADAATVQVLAEVTGQPWVEPVPGVPCWAGDALVTVQDRLDLGPEGTRAVVVDGQPLSPPGLQVRRVLHADADRLVVAASHGDATSIGVYEVGVATGDVTPVLDVPGIHAASVGGTTRVEVSATMAGPATTAVVTPDARRPLPDRALDPGLDVDVTFHRLGPDDLHAGLLVPPGDGPFPVLLDPYGGPHAQRVVRSRNAWLVSSWFAAHGYAVLVVDGRGTPGRSPTFEHAIHGRLAEVVLDDQVDALHSLAEVDPRLDLDRVAIRGWSFGGFLAGLAALRRPDVVRAAIVGAPNARQDLYDTHYSERYLGHPDDTSDAYRASSLVDGDGELVAAVDPPDGHGPPRMLVIHGLVDDNVLAAHSLELSRALLAAGRPHEFLPLSGVTHITPQEEVSANLLRLQLDFLDRSLAPGR